jgi:uncharacterized delta-60 repeat protein
MINIIILMAYDNRPNLSCQRFDQRSCDTLYLQGTNCVCGSGGTISSNSGYRISGMTFLNAGVVLNTVLIGCNASGGTAATSIGAGAKAMGTSSTSIGCGSCACGTGAVSIGSQSKTFCNYGAVVGCGNISCSIGGSILGGYGNIICSGNTNTTLIGAQNCILAGTGYTNMVVVPNLVISTTPSGSGNVLGYDTVTKKVCLTTAGGGITGATNGLSDNGVVVRLGGQLSNNTGVGYNGSCFMFSGATGCAYFCPNYTGFEHNSGNTYVAVDGNMDNIQLSVCNTYLNMCGGPGQEQLGMATPNGTGIGICNAGGYVYITSSGNSNICVAPNQICLGGLPAKTTETCVVYIDAGGVLSYGMVSGGTSGGITGATNGLSVYGMDIGLGGDLSGNTTISLKDHSLNILNSHTGLTVGTGFNGSSLNTVKIQSDGKILVSGYIGTYSGVSKNDIIRLCSNGSIDDTLNIGSGFDSPPATFAVQTDGKIVAAGNFTTYSGASNYGIVRLCSSGSIDNTFNTGSGFSSYVCAVAVQSNGRILTGGIYSTYSGVTSEHVTRLMPDGSLDSSFNTGNGITSNSVTVIVVQPDNKILLGGTFTDYSGATARGIVRLNSNGGLDNTFNSGDGFLSSTVVNSITLQPDGRMLVGGWFTSYSGVTANHIIRLYSGGTVDYTFTGGTQFNSDVNSIVLQPDGRVLVGGGFTSYSGVTANYIIRLMPDGGIDSTFNTGVGFDSFVNSMVLQPDGRIVVIGGFSTYQNESYSNIIRLNSDGSIDKDSVYDATFNGRVLEYGGDYSADYTDRSLVDKEYVDKTMTGGTAVTAWGNITGAITGQTDLNNCLNSYIKGAVNLGSGSGVYSSTVNNNLRLKTFYAGSGITLANETSGITIAALSSFYDATNGLGVDNTNVILGGELNKDTTIDLIRFDLNIQNSNTGFTIGSGFNNILYVIKVQDDGKILAGGPFTTYSGATAQNFIRLNYDGSIDETLKHNSGFTTVGYVESIAVQIDGKIIVGGYFKKYSGQTVNGIVRLNTDGTIDNTFVTGTAFDYSVNTLVVQTDGKILAGGQFTVYSGVTADKIIRLNSNGGIDTGFVVGVFDVSANIHDIKIQTDGKILVGGLFTSYSGTTSRMLIRLNTNGDLDTSFNNGGYGFDGSIEELAVQNDGKIIAVGHFSAYNGTTARGIARLHADGSLDTGFNPGGFGFFNSSNGVWSVDVQDDGRIVVGGFFISYNGTSRLGFIRLNSNGSIDRTFNYGGGFNNYVETVKVQDDGKILVGGLFTTYSGYTSPYIIRLRKNGLIDNQANNLKVVFGENTVDYGGDYSSYYTDRSLVDKAWVLDQIVSGVTMSGVSGAINGLSMNSANKVGLGGDLTGNTVINGAAYCMALSNGNLKICNNSTINSYSGYQVSGVTIFSAGKTIDLLQIGCGACAVGMSSIAIGCGAGYLNSGGTQIAIGRWAGQYNKCNTTVAIGDMAGYQSCIGSLVAIGNQAGRGAYGDNQVAIGNQSGYQSSGSSQIAIGNTAGMYNRCNRQIAIGLGAGNSNCGWEQIAIGDNAGQQNKGTDQIAIGNFAGQNNTGSTQIAIGVYAGYFNKAANVISIGKCAGYNNVIANQFILKEYDVCTCSLIQGDFSTGEVHVRKNAWFYFGNSGETDSWRMGVSGATFVHQCWTGGGYVTKSSY